MRLGIILLSFFSSFQLLAFEDAQVLPKGVRRLSVKTFHTNISEKTNASRKKVKMAEQLEKNVSYNDFVKARDGYSKKELEAFLLSNNIDFNESVGQLQADIKGNINVFAPNFAIGVTDRLSLGFAVPIYHARSDVAVAFAPNDAAQGFVDLLASPEVGRFEKSREATDALNGVVDTLNEKLRDNGYDELGYWEKIGLGDILLKAKYSLFSNTAMRMASVGGMNLPTGRVDDPDNLTDIAFGDGTWDVFGGLMIDEMLSGPFFLNQYIQYTAQLPSHRKIRMKTEDESIAVQKKDTYYKLGDKIDGGASVQLDHFTGMQAGLGYVFFHKFKDQYRAGESSRFYEEDTEQTAHLGEAMMGYSSVKAFRRNQMAVPFSVSLGYLHQLQSRNMPVANQYKIDTKVYF